MAVTACLLGDLSARRELGKVGTQSDLHLHDFKHDGQDVTVLVPDRYPDQLKCLSYAVLGADTAVLVVAKIDAGVGEQILAADAAGIASGVVVLQNYLQPEQLRPLLAGTALETWMMQTEEDWPAARAALASAAPTARDGELRVPIDHHFDVKGVGAVVLGVVKQGTLHKGDTLHAYPDKVICPVRSIQCHDVDVADAGTGDRVGLALRNTKAEQLDRGMVLAPPDAALRVVRVGTVLDVALSRSKFSKQPLAAGSVVHLGFGMQFVPARLEGDAPAAGDQARVKVAVEKDLVVDAGQAGIMWHVDAKPQRVVGRIVAESP